MFSSSTVLAGNALGAHRCGWLGWGLFLHRCRSVWYSCGHSVPRSERCGSSGKLGREAKPKEAAEESQTAHGLTLHV